FSEFCARFWADRPFINAGDDWGLPALGWTKMSYRPVRMLQKYSLRQLARTIMPAPRRTSPAAGGYATNTGDAHVPGHASAVVRAALKQDLTAATPLTPG